MRKRWLLAGLGVILAVFSVLTILGILNELMSTKEGPEPIFDVKALNENTERLLKEADDQGIDVSEAEVSEEIGEFLKASGKTEEDLSVLLKERGASLEEFREVVERDIILQKLLEEELRLSEVEVSDQELKDLIGVEEDLQSDDPLISAVWEESRERLLMLKQAELIGEYLEGLNEDE
jgi:parvulin-like peptidyl-prolyl isomerase